MLRRVEFTQEELVQMLQGEELELNDNVSHITFAMRKETSILDEISESLEKLMVEMEKEEPKPTGIIRLTKKETRDFLKGKKTPNQIRAEHGFPPVNDCALNKVNEYAQDITLMQHRALSPDEFLKKHGFLKVDDVFDLLLEDMFNKMKGEK